MTGSHSHSDLPTNFSAPLSLVSLICLVGQAQIDNLIYKLLVLQSPVNNMLMKEFAMNLI